jgi:ribosomal protein S18 acetylase RimI-like enzyme
VVRVAEFTEGDAFRQLAGLGELLIDVVRGGASVGFMATITQAEAEAFWESMADGIPSGATVLFAALDGRKLVGTVLLHPSRKPNQPHRADVAKLLVLGSARRAGVATLLMDALEAQAMALGRTLLTLDTATGSGAELFYQARGFERAGIIPNYALYPDGSACDTTFYYKRLGQP